MQLEADSSTAPHRNLLAQIVEKAWFENCNGSLRANLFFRSSDFTMMAFYLQLDADKIRAAANLQYGKGSDGQKFRAHSIAKRKKVRSK